MKFKHILAFLLLLTTLSCIFSGCTPIEQNINQPTLKYQTQYPASAQEYNLAINKKIVPVFNVIEGHAAKAQDIINGRYPIENEIASVEDSLKYLNDIYESCKVIYPPTSETQRHQDTLMQLKRVINSVEVYQEVLADTTDLGDTKQKEDINKAADIMKSEYISLKNMFNIEA